MTATLPLLRPLLHADVLPAASAPVDSLPEHPFAVWEYTGTGFFLRTFPDIDLAAQFVMNHGGVIISNPANW